MGDLVVGMHTQVSKGIPRVFVVVLDQDASGQTWSVRSSSAFIPQKGHNFATILHELANWLEHELDIGNVRAGIVTDLDLKGRYKDTLLLQRHSADGIALAALRSKTSKAVMQSHSVIARALGLSKEQALANAANLCGEEYKHAVAAAQAATLL